jgi:anaerobic selenocysteine-containing dehydrogenase
VVVQDLFLTETAELADVVLPAAGWGEKTGTFTNVNRTVHLSDKAVDPPGEARSDLDIFLDYHDRMGFTDKDGQPLLKARTPEAVFEAWKACTAGRPIDYTGLSYERLRSAGTGIPWPVNGEHPDGTDRLYTDGVFPTDPEVCEVYGHDLLTGAAIDETTYRAKQPAGRAFLKAARYHPAPEEPSEEFPLRLTTGRTAYQFHTRTKTARARPLQAAAPDPWVEVSPEDATRMGIKEGDLVRVVSPRGSLEAPARIADIVAGVVFVPFHYGGGPGAANEATLTAWDPVSKQPLFKVAAVRLELVEARVEPSNAPTTTASAPVILLPGTHGTDDTASQDVETPTYPNDPSMAGAR